MGVQVFSCCFVARWVCYVGARGTCGGRCGVVRECLVVGVELACGVRGFQGLCRWGGGGRSRRGPASFLCWWAVLSHAPGWGGVVRCGRVFLGCVVLFPAVMGGAPCPGLVGWVVAPCWSSGGVGQPRAVSRSSLWRVPVRGPCRVVVVWGLGSPGAGCVGFECRNQGAVVAWCFWGVGPPLSGPSGVGSAVYGRRAGCHDCGVRGLMGPGISGVLWPRCGACGS